MDPKISKNLICPLCLDKINYSENKLTCQRCKKTYQVTNDVPYFVDADHEMFNESSNDILINQFKNFFKKYPSLFNTIYNIFGTPFLGKSAKETIRNLGEDKIILNLGSGARIIRKDVIDVDFYPFPNVKVVADIAKLPFKNNSVDAVICEAVLEHTKDPQIVVKEIKRVLKLNGIVYIVVPFIFSFHSSPNDYYRWSKEGLRELMNKFEEKEIGIRQGPTSTLISMGNEWLATLLSFGSQRLQQILLVIFMVITLPLKVFDYLMFKFSTSQNIANTFYYIGIKKTN